MKIKYSTCETCKGKSWVFEATPTCISCQGSECIGCGNCDCECDCIEE